MHNIYRDETLLDQNPKFPRTDFRIWKIKNKKSQYLFIYLILEILLQILECWLRVLEHWDC